MHGTNARTLPNVTGGGSLRQRQKLLHSKTRTRLNSISFIVSEDTTFNKTFALSELSFAPRSRTFLTESVYCVTIKRYVKRFNGRLAARKKTRLFFL